MEGKLFVFSVRNAYFTNQSCNPKDEAFSLWTEWEEQYAPNSSSQKILKEIGDRYWLVNVVHNDFQKPDLLFDVMLS